MTTFKVLVSTSAQALHWQLAGILGTPTSVLLGWRQTPAPVDAGVPGAVAGVLSRALCRCARVSFLSGSPEAIAATHAKGSYSLQPVMEPGRLLRRILSWAGRPARGVLVSSRDPSVVRQLFEDDHFSWVMQGQYVFLSGAPDAAPDLEEVLSKVWRGRREDAPMRVFEDRALTGIMRPGVDGDVAGMLFRSVANREGFLAALQEEVEADGMQLSICSEAEFMESLAGESRYASSRIETRGV